MTKRPNPFLTGVMAAAVVAAPAAFSVDLTGAARAAEPLRGQVADAPSRPAAAPSDGWYRFGPAATVIEREEIVADGVTLVTLSNGVRLVLKPTNLVADEILVNVIVDGGLQSLLPEPGVRAAAEIAETTFVSAGVGLKTREQLAATFGPVASSIAFNIWSDRFNLGAKAKPDELRPLLEILTAYVSDPGWRFEGLDAVKTAEIENANSFRSMARLALSVQSTGLLMSGDPRYVRPTEAELLAVDENDARQTIERQFRAGVIEIAIVGDFDREAAISMAAATFGALPARAGVAPYPAPPFPPHTTAPLQVYFNGDPEDQARMVAWPAPLGLFKSKEEQVISTLTGVIVHRLLALPAYEKAGFVKGGLAAENGYVSMAVFRHPETLAQVNLDNFSPDVARIVQDIVARGVTQQEIDIANAGSLADMSFMESRAPNQYWLVTAMNIRGDRNNWVTARSIPANVAGVTPDEVRNAAARYLVEDRSVEITAVPAPVER